jgi:NAD-dependent dihydropyrimidine dehydrogenase PreA subunit
MESYDVQWIIFMESIPLYMDDEDLAEMGTAMLKDEDVCIRCGLCAEKCPTQAVTMDVMNYSFRWIG